jgi:Class II flagellar assembly regulator
MIGLGGNFCRCLYRRLTIPAQASGVFGDRRFRRLGLLAMRIYGPNGAALANAPSGARRAKSGTFTVGGQEAPHNAAAAGSLRAIATVDALIALQGVEDPTERKKRAVTKGRSALDVLDTLKLGLIDGSVDQSTLARLKVAADGLTEGSGDAGLDTVLGEIDLRVAVELAKAGIR